MSFVSTLANASTSTGENAAVKFDEPRTLSSIQLITTGDPDTVVVSIETSLDGVNFFGTTGISNTTPMISADIMTLYVRANIEEISGGTSPTVTVLAAVN